MIISVNAFATEQLGVAATSYVTGAFDALNASKQAKLTTDALVPAAITDTVKTSVSSSSVASDTSLVTEKAVSSAIETATTVTDNSNGVIQDVSNSGGGLAITRGDAQIVVKSGGVYSSTATMWIE